MRTDDGSVTSALADSARMIASQEHESSARSQLPSLREPQVVSAAACQVQPAGRDAGLEYELPSFTWDEFLVDSILEARLKDLGLETIGDLGALAVYALESHLAGTTGLRAQQLLYDFKDMLERNLIFRPWSTTLEMSSSHSPASTSYECRVKDDEAALSWRVDLDCAEFEDISARVTTPRGVLNYAEVRTSTSWECRTPADLLARTVFPFFDLDSYAGSALETLTPSEQKILTLRFGLEDGESRTLEAVGREFNVTRERIRQREAKAVGKLRHVPSRSRNLKAVSRLEDYLANLLALGFGADFFTGARAALGDKTSVNPKGFFLLLRQVFGKKDWPPPLIDFERRVFENLVDRLGRLPAEHELVLPPADVVREVISEDAVRKIIESHWPLFSPYGRLKLVAPHKLRSRRLKIDSTRVRLNALIHVLRSEGSPLHFTEIAQRANPRLPSKHKMTEHNVYAWLTRYTDRFVWAGQGKYGLKEWNIGRRADRDSVAVPEGLYPQRRRGIAEEIILLLLEAGKPLQISDVEKHILSRFSVNLASVQAAIEQDGAGRFILGTDGRVSLARWARTTRQRPFIDSLDIGSIAFPFLKGALRRKAIDLSRDVTLGAVRQFVNVGIEQWNQEFNDPCNALTEAFNTNTRFNHLRRALSLFDEQFDRWKGGSRRDSRFSWILPDGLADELLSERSHWRDIESRLRGVRSWRSRLWRSGHVDGWLPLLSMEGVVAVRRSQNSGVMRLSAILGIACLRLGLEPHLRPWLAGWPAQLSALPVGWLYQFDPTPRSETILRRLDEAGCTNVGHLVILNPEALELCRRVSTRDWATLKIALHR